MASPKGWLLLPADLLELQIGQIHLLMAMYPDDVIVGHRAQQLLESLGSGVNDGLTGLDGDLPKISVVLNLPLPAPPHKTSQAQPLELELTIAFGYEGYEIPQEPPKPKVRVRQPPWMSKAATIQIMSQIPAGEDMPGTIECIRNAASELLAQSSEQILPTTSPGASADSVDMVRVGFYFPSISTRSKRDDFVKHAPSYSLTGFLYAGKPGLLCVEGKSQNIDDYMKFIKRESWSDIPAHHKKVSERYRSTCDQRVFSDMTEITDMLGERRGQKGNRGDMQAIEKWLKEKGLGDVFAKVLM